MDDGSVKITLRKAEQLKLPSNIDIDILMAIRWTNSEN
jgi:hypothetical protein